MRFKSSPERKRLTILGATGSIGESTLNVIQMHPDKFQVYALSCHSNVTRLVQQAILLKPALLITTDTAQYKMLCELVDEAGLNCQVECGEAALCMAASHKETDIVMAAIVGAAGLLPTFAAVKAGKKVLLANKEALVMSGQLFMDAVQQCNATLLPVDSEHNAIFQSLPEGRFDPCSIRKILLTGSGGPFLTRDMARFSEITPAEACKHPNWSMGQKISVDSATMMNKGLEFIEARWLFDANASDIEVLIHPQSIVHSMVQYVDGSVIAQMGQPDMRTPIAHTLSWPDRIESGVSSLDFTRLSHLTFEAPDYQRFPCLKLAMAASEKGQAATTALNAANEVAVAAFLAGSIRFTDITAVCEHAVVQLASYVTQSIEDIVALDTESRTVSKQFMNTHLKGTQSMAHNQ